MSFAPNFTQGNYLPETVVVPNEEKDLSEFLKNVLEDHARFINRKETAQYETVETQVNQQFPGADPQTKRLVFRKIINTGGLPNAASTTTAHGISGIDNNWFFTRIYGSAIEPAGVLPRPIFIPLPNNGPTYPVEIWVDTTNVTINTTANLSAFTSSQVILEFYKI